MTPSSQVFSAQSAQQLLPLLAERLRAPLADHGLGPTFALIAHAPRVDEVPVRVGLKYVDEFVPDERGVRLADDED